MLACKLSTIITYHAKSWGYYAYYKAALTSKNHNVGEKDLPILETLLLASDID